MPGMKRITGEEKKPIRIGFFLMLIATAMILIVTKIDSITEGLKAVSSALVPFIAGFALAFILNVFVSLFENFLFKPIDKRTAKPRWMKIRRPLAILLSIALLVCFFLFLMFFIIPELIESVKTLGVIAQKSIPHYINVFRDWLENLLRRENIAFDVQQLFDQFRFEDIISNVSKWSSDLIVVVYNAMMNMVSIVLTAIIAFIFSIYLLFGKEKLKRNFKRMFKAYVPDKITNPVFDIAKITNEVFYSFIKGQLLESGILTLLCYLGMLIFRFDYALLISMIVGISAMVPILGAYAGAFLGAFILVLVNPMDALLFLIFIIILQQIEGNVIYPRVVGSSIGLPAIWTMFAVFFWGTLFGIPGVLIGTPGTAVLYRMLKENSARRLRERGVDPESVETITVNTRDEKESE